jgi:anti-anti-sigma factor
MSTAQFGRIDVPTPRTERPTGGDRTPGAEVLRLHSAHPAPGVVVLEAAGVLDINSATRFAEAVRAHLSTARTAVLDLSALSFLSTHGVVVLLEAGHRALMRQANLVLITQNRVVDRLLGLLDVADRFTYADTVDAAIGTPAPAIG